MEGDGISPQAHMGEMMIRMAVQRIIYNGHAVGGKMDPDLMGPAGIKGAADEADAIADSFDTGMGQSVSAPR